MTLQIDGPARGENLAGRPRRPRPRPALPAPGHSAMEPAATVVVPATDQVRTCGLDRFARRAYASAGIGAVIAAAASAVLHQLDWPMHTKAGQLLFALLVVGAGMVFGGSVTGSLRPRSHFGGER